MTAQARNHYVIVDITLKERGTSSTQVWRFCNRPVIEKTATPVFATLKEVSGLEVDLSPSGIPNKANGAIVLRDNPGTIGQDRRFVDILQRWEIVERPCTIRILAIDPSGAAVTAAQIESGGTTVWTGKITNWTKEVDGDEELLTLETEGLTIDRKSMSIPLDSTYTNDPSALGKNLQVVFGGNDLSSTEIRTQIQAYSSGTLLSPNTRYYYAMGLGDPTAATGFKYPDLLDPGSFPTDDFPGVWIQADERGYLSVPPSGFDGYSTPGGSLGSSTISSPGTAEYAVGWTPIKYPGIVLGGRMAFNGVGAVVTPGGQLVFKAYYGDSATNKFPDDSRVLAQATVEKSVYHTDLQGAGDFWVEFRFDTPVIVPWTETDYYQELSFWISVQLTSYVPGSDFVPATNGASALPDKTATRGSNNEWVTGSGPALCDYYVCPMTESATAPDSQGRSAAYVQLEPGTPPAHCTDPDLAKLDMVMTTGGILDATSGGVGAGAGVNIARPDHAIKLLSRRWDGSTWADPGYQTTWATELSAVFDSSAQYYRRINGSLGGDVTADDLIEEICEEHALKYVPLGQSYTLWAWGTKYPTAFVFNDENSLVTGYRCGGKDTVINEVELNVDQAYIYKNATRQTAAKGAGFNVSFKFDAATDHEYAAICPDSILAYGRNRNRKQTAKLLYGTSSARALGQYLIRNYDRPDIEIEWSCPYVYGVNDLPVASVVEIVSTALPAYFGANPDAQPPSYNGELSTLFAGIIAVRAERHRVQILGKKIEIDDDGFRIKYRGRLIGAYHPYDPT